MRIAIIGGTAAGPAAAAEAIRRGPGAEVVLYEQEPFISTGACEIPYLLGGLIEDWRRLEVLTPRQFEQSRGGIVRERHRVREIRPRERRLVVEALEYGSVHDEPYDRLILAVGARPRRLGIEGEDAPNVFHIRTLDSARVLTERLEREPPRHVVMVGGGYVGVEVAEMLRLRGLRVTILEPVGRVLGQTLSPTIGKHFDQAIRRHGILVRKERPVRFDLGRDGRVRAVHTDRKEVIGCDLVLVSIGLTPNSEIAAAAGIRLEGGGTVAVDEHMQTSAAGIYACGDCITVPHVAMRERIYMPLAQVGRRSARVAARNAARGSHGGRATFAPVVRIIGVKAFEVEAAQAGLTEEEAAAAGFDVVTAEVRHWTRAHLYPGSRPLHVRLVVEKGSGRLLGGELVGEEGAALRANVLVPLIREGYTARKILDEIDLIYNPPIAPSVDPLLIACSQAAKAAEGR
jgi:NADPH-dependent 2,4-dienoyl-CoA reductase/sulfur reductase-like enzyme